MVSLCRNTRAQRVHCDASIPAARGEGETDILAMLCLRPAPDGGGATRLASAVHPPRPPAAPTARAGCGPPSEAGPRIGLARQIARLPGC
jgi:hypothetical protein